jgi:release factor glutamine methyltransferase
VSAGTAGAAPAGVGRATVRAVVRDAEVRLREAGCPTPRLDAELLVADALGVDRRALFAAPERRPSAVAAGRVAERVGRRVAREPVAYIVGRRGFRGLELAVDRRVLVPRPETELLVEVALGVLAAGGRVHDVGTGSGAVALALKDERPSLEVSASDTSEGAVVVARTNAARLGLDVEISLARGLPAGDYDLVVANLPYIGEHEWPALVPEIVRHEPVEALIGGGGDGLDAIRALVAEAPAGTLLALEHAPGQAPAVRALLRGAQSFRGLAGGEDVTLGHAP